MTHIYGVGHTALTATIAVAIVAIFLIGLPLAWILVEPFVMLHSLMERHKCAWAAWSGFKVLLTRRVGIPLLVGCGLCWSSLLLSGEIDKSYNDILNPIAEADEKLQSLIIQIDNFVTRLPLEMIAYLNNATLVVNGALDVVVSKLAITLQDAVYVLMNDIEAQVNYVLHDVGSPSILLPKSWSFQVRLNLIPSIPVFNTSCLAIPPNAISLQNLLMPLINHIYQARKTPLPQ